MFRRFLIIPSLLVVALAILFLTPPATVAQQTGIERLQIERELAWIVSEPRMQAAVRQLCDIGPRMGGTKSNETSAAWLAAEFERAGLEVRIRKDAPQRFHEEDGWEVAVVGGEALGAAWPLGGSPSGTGTGRLSLEAGPDIVWLTSERLNAEAAQGCLAVLYDGRTSESGWPTVGGLRGEWNIPVFGISRSEGAMLRSVAAEEPDTRIRIRLESRTGTASPLTVIATLPGRDRSRYFLFSAHGDSDSGGPGADDNASGVAVILEVARAMSAAVRMGLMERPAYDIRFAPWGSEISSTRDYVRELLERDRLPEGVINYDQPGFGSWYDAIYFEPDDIPTNRGLITILRSIAQDHLGQPGFPERYASTRSQGGTDSYVFQSERLVGEQIVPSVTVYTSAWGQPRTLDVTPGFPPVNWYEDEEPGKVTVDGDAFYHSSGDTPENTTDREPFNMGWSARIGLLAALRFMAGESPPAPY